MKAEIILGAPGDSSIVIDGKELNNLVGGVRIVRMDGAVEIEQTAHTFPTVELSLVLVSAAVNFDGEVIINAEPVSDEIGKAIYESLKDKYG